MVIARLAGTEPGLQAVWRISLPDRHTRSTPMCTVSDSARAEHKKNKYSPQFAVNTKAAANSGDKLLIVCLNPQKNADNGLLTPKK